MHVSWSNRQNPKTRTIHRWLESPEKKIKIAQSRRLVRKFQTRILTDVVTTSHTTCNYYYFYSRRCGDCVIQVIHNYVYSIRIYIHTIIKKKNSYCIVFFSTSDTIFRWRICVPYNKYFLLILLDVLTRFTKITYFSIWWRRRYINFYKCATDWCRHFIL